MHRIISLLLLAYSVSGFTQNKSFKISGTVLASDTQMPLESATVYLEQPKDSALVTYTISDKIGAFVLENSTYASNLNLFVSYVGYKTHYQKVNIIEGAFSLDPISLEIDDNALDEVVIKTRAPVTIKKDTLEFNVASFKTKKDATVEDLLRELPGVEVDENGKITVNGKDVSNILVNGKPFFGEDPTIATRNLTKELIEKVQVVDTKTKSEAFAGEEGDSENKTINLTISEENNKGVFGRVAAGGGTDERYEYAGIVNVFNEDQRFSVLAGGNNTNTPGFSFGEIQKMFGNASSMSVSSSGAFSIDGRSFGGGEGIVTSRNIGSNYADEFGEGFDLSADYFYSESDSENESKTQRENILPDTRFFSNSERKTLTSNANHSFGSTIDIEVDSTFLINLRPSFQYGRSKRSDESSEESFNEDNELTNSSTASSFRESNVRNFRNDLDLTKRIGSNGSFVKASLDLTFNSAEGDEFLRSEALLEDPDEEDVLRDQFTDESSSSNRFFISSTYRLPLKPKEVFLDVGVRFDGNTRNTTNGTFDFNQDTQQYDQFNEDLSTDFKYVDNSTRPSLKFTINKDKWSFSTNIAYVYRTLDNRDDLRPDLSLRQNFEAVETGAFFNVKLNEKANIYGSYDLSNSPPQINQLTPFQNVTDPLNTITGNPNLEPTNTHNMYVSYNSYDFQNRTGFFGYFNVQAINNQVVTRTIVDDNFIRNTTYDNVDGNYRAYGFVNYSKSVKIDSLRNIKLSGGLSANINRAINFNNDVQYASLNNSVTPSLGLTFSWKDILEFKPNYSISITRNSFDLPEFESQEFTRHSLRIGATTFVPKKFEWRNDVNFSYNPDVAPGFQKAIWFWNTTLAYSMLKDKATLTLKVYDVLNQNNNSQRTANANFIQDSESTVLQRFAMLSFSYKFNNLGAKGETSDNNGFLIID